MPYLAGNCTYRYSYSVSRYSRCGWLIDGQIASASADPAPCGGSATCSSTVFSTNLCGASTTTPKRTINLTNKTGYHIYQKWLTSPCSCLTPSNTSLCNDGHFKFGGASITNEQTKTTLTMTCLVYIGGGVYSATPLDTKQMYQGNCYHFPVACYHDYLNNAKFSAAGATNTFWTQTCQPCY